MEDPLAMSLASLVMSRPGSVMDDRPGSAMSILSGISPTKTPVRSRKLRNSTSISNLESNSRGEIGSYCCCFVINCQINYKLPIYDQFWLVIIVCLH